MFAWINKLLPPGGYSLEGGDGRLANRIRIDVIPDRPIVIVQRGRTFVATGKRDDYGFLVYLENHRLHEYQSWD